MVLNVRSSAPQKIFTCEWKSSSFCNYLSAPPRFSFFFFSFSSANVLFARLLHHFFLAPAENLSDAACNCLVTHAPTKNCPYFFLTFCSFYFMFLFLLLPPPYHPLPSACRPYFPLHLLKHSVTNFSWLLNFQMFRLVLVVTECIIFLIRIMCESS